MHPGTSLTDAIRQWPTPSATPYGSSQNGRESGHVRPSNGTPSLENQARALWNTPRVGAHGQPGNHGTAEDSLEPQARMWATPTSHERTHAPRSVDHGEQLANQASMWSTPRTTDMNGPGAHGDGGEDLRSQVSRLAQPTAPAGNDGPPRAVLNPCFVEALQGFPIGWTEVG